MPLAHSTAGDVRHGIGRRAIHCHRGPELCEQPDLLASGGRVGFLALWANDIEAAGGSLEERRAEYRELLGEMCLFEEDLDEAEEGAFLPSFVAADLEHDATADPQ